MSEQQEKDTHILQPFLKQLPQGTVVKHVKALKALSKAETYEDYSVTHSVQSERWFTSDTRLPMSEIQLYKLLEQQARVLKCDYAYKNMIENLLCYYLEPSSDAAKYKPTETEEIQQNNEQLLTKEEFKYLKGKVYSIQEAMNEIMFLGTLKVTLEKINVWKPDGTKEVLKRSKLRLEYNLNVQELDKLNNLLENHWNTIPENLREITSTKIRDPAIQKEEIKAKFQEAFAAKGVTINYYTFDTHTYKYNPEKQLFEFKTDSQIQVQVQDLTIDRYLAVRDPLFNELDQFKNQRDDDDNRKVINEIISDLQSSLVKKVGDQFETIKNYTHQGDCQKHDQEKTNNIFIVIIITITYIPTLIFFLDLTLNSSILIIDYWQFTIYSEEQIESILKLLKQNAEKFGNDVRIVKLSNGCSSFNIKQLIDSHEEWQKQIEFYFPTQNQKEDLFKYGTQNSSPLIVVDKFNTIRILNPVEITEELITSLLSEQQPQPKEETVEIQVDPAQIQEILVSSNAILTQTDPQKVLQLELVLKSKTLNKTLIVSKPELQFFARDYQEQQVQSVLNQLFNVIPESQWTISKTISKTVSIPYPGQECAVCKKDITQEPQQYYSPFKTEHVCTECAEYDDKEKKGNARFKYLDTLIFINGPLSDPSVLHNIDDHKLGKNKKLQDGEEGSQEHEMSCNGCGESQSGPRYISITARSGRYRDNGYVEYCQNCFLSLKDKTSEKAKEIVAKDINEGMVLDSLFTRVLFWHGGYQDF